MATDLVAISSFADGKVKDIDVPAVQPSAAQWAHRTFRLNYAHAKILGLLLAYQSPRDFVTGQAIDIAHALAWQNAKEFHHFFPQAYLKSIGVSTSKASALANMVYLSSASNKAISDRAPADYLKELLAKNEQQTREWLATNLIENDAINAALANDYAAFLGARSETIDREARRLAGW